MDLEPFDEGTELGIIDHLPCDMVPHRRRSGGEGG